MSAAEKLKALAAKGHRIYLNGVDVDICSQMLAVVEAVERDSDMGDADDATVAALAALDETLGGAEALS